MKGRGGVRLYDEAPLVAHIIYRLGIGGLENGLVNLINSIPERKYRHAVVCLAGYSDFSRRIERTDVRIFDLEKKPGKDPSCYFRLFRLLRELRPEIVHTRNLAALDCQFVAAAARVNHRIHSEHGWDVGDLHGTLGKHVLMRRLSRSVVHQYAAVSEHMADWLENVNKIPKRKVTQIYNGTDTKKFRPRIERSLQDNDDDQKEPRPFVIGCVGRLDPIKDHITLLRAFKSLVQRLPRGGDELRLIIVGGGAMQYELAQYVSEMQLDTLVIFAGESDDVASQLRTFDVFVLPSLNEGISNTILEAMATGLPIITTRVGGNPELVQQDVTGLLISAGDSAALTDNLRFYLENPDIRRKHGAAGRSRAVKSFSLDSMVDQYVELYDQATRKRRAQQGNTG